MDLKYKRVLVKISGEALGSRDDMPSGAVFKKTVAELAEIHNMGVQLAVVVGGGNIWRGRERTVMDRPTSDYMGMLATAINALCLADALRREGVECRVLTAFAIENVGEMYHQQSAIRYLEEGQVIIFACGTGHPFFSTDTGATLRGAEIGADVVLLAKNIDGVYDSDPRVNPEAKRYESISYGDYLAKNLKAMDPAAVSIAADQNLKVLLFGLQEENCIKRAVLGEQFGTLLY
ncbi:MAG: UMP kinase [Clostridia bacterium]|nr:UMP kinase [Clostridia bacterium]